MCAALLFILCGEFHYCLYKVLMLPAHSSLIVRAYITLIM